MAQQTVSDSLFLQKIESEQLVDSTAEQRFAYHFFEGARHYHHWQLDSALSSYDACLQIQPENATVYYELSRIYQAKKEYETAFDLLKKAVAINPENAEYQQTLMMWYASFGQFDRAIEGYRELLRKDPSNEQYLYALLELYGAAKQPKKQLEILKRFEELQGVSEENSYQQLSLLFSLNRYRDAEKQLKKLIRKFPYETAYVAALGDFYLGINKEKKGFACYNQILENDSTDGQVLMSLANYYQQNGDAEKSTAYMLKSLHDKRLSIENRMQWLRSYVVGLLQSGDTLRSDSLFSELLQLYPDEEKLLDLHVDYLLHLGDSVLAQSQLRKMIELNPKNEATWQKLLMFYYHATPQETLNFAEEVLTYFPKAYQWNYIKILMLASLERSAEMYDAIDFTITTIPDYPKKQSELYGLKADYLQREKRYAEMLENYELALSLDAENNMVKNNYAYFLACANLDLKYAEELSSAAVKSDPQSATFLDTYAWVLFMRGDYRLARFYQERALAADSVSSTEIYEHYGDILSMLGETDLAVKQWIKALEFAPNSEILHQKIEQKQYIPSILEIDESILKKDDEE